jgi:DnaJ-class molecular chaperone
MKKNYYELLELTPDASQTDIRKNYKKLALKWHPDKNIMNTNEALIKFKNILEAFRVLSDSNLFFY